MVEYSSRYFQNSTLLTNGLSVSRSHPHLSHFELTILHILLDIWICLSNGSQLINILLTPALRCRPRNILVVNICFIELVIGLFVCPLYTDSLLVTNWRHIVPLCISFEAVFYAQTCVSTLAVLVLLVDRFYYLLSPRTLGLTWRWAVTTLLVILPWFIGLSLVCPLVVYGSTAGLNKDTRSCQVIWRTKYQTTTVFISFFLPAFLILTLATISVIAYVILSILDKRQPSVVSTDCHQEKRDSLCVILLASLASVALQFPYFILALIDIFCEDGGRRSCDTSESVWSQVMLANIIKSGVLPLVWLAYSDIRRGFMCYYRRSRPFSSVPSSEEEIVYRSKSTIL
ncbi:histamine H1 receptor-like [Biomphalaria glabrata]|uniref:Histamine H1 receptor-like n=1 Tax=Biomphalaria glabrata TaxID=6526 RepID=A0A9W3BPG0_BIOGL|nr:histamine H1 receptor-like [Biomphalaria glabrata]